MERAADLEPALDEPQYSGEDTRLTSQKELSGWYSYGWAAEVHYFVTAAVMHIPDHALLGLCHLWNWILHTDHPGTACPRARCPLARQK